jgi:integrase
VYFYKEKFLLNDNENQLIYKSDRSPNWYLRFWTGKEYINKSLRSSDKKKAVANALLIVSDIETKLAFNKPLKEPNIIEMLEWYIRSRFSVDQSDSRRNYIKQTCMRVADFFGNKKVERISDDDWYGYWEWRLELSAANKDGKFYSVKDKSGLNRPSLATLRAERQTYNQVVRAAIETNNILRSTKMPAFPQRRFGDFYRPQKAKPKDTYTKAEYSKLRDDIRDESIRKQEQVARRFEVYPHNAAGEGLYKEAYIARALQAYISIIRNCGCRPTEPRRIKISDLVEVKVKTPAGDRVAMGLTIRSSKSRAYHKRVAILTYTGEQAVLEWLKFRQKIGLVDTPESYLFSDYADDSIMIHKDTLPRAFDRALRRLGWWYFEDGSKMNMRAIRRLFIITRLDAGVDINLVAMNCGNSASTIRAFYDSVQLSRYASDIYSASYYPEDEDC